MSHQELPPADAPAGFVPIQALAVPDAQGTMQLLAAAHPLPVEVISASAGGTTVSGTAGTGNSLSVPFEAEPGLPVWLTLSGNWIGTVVCERSDDGGVTWNRLTAGGRQLPGFAAAAHEAVLCEARGGIAIRLNFNLISGTAAYRVSQ